MDASFTRSELRKVAKFYRLVSWAILAGIGANALMFLSATSSPWIQLVVSVLAIGVSIFQVYVLYNLAKSLKISGGFVVAIIFSAFVPILALATLAYLHEGAMKVFKSAGLKVGFMGADPASIKDE